MKIGTLQNLIIIQRTHLLITHIRCRQLIFHVSGNTSILQICCKLNSGTNVVAGIQSSYELPGLAEGALLGGGNDWPEPCGA